MTDRSVVYRLQAEVTQFKSQMAAAGASVKKSADDMTAATKEGAKFRTGLDQLGGVAGKVGLVAAAGLGAAIVKAANFDQAMSQVQAATHETADNMDLLRQAALDAGAATAFSATEAAAGIEELSKAGVATTDILSGGLSGALDLAAAGGIGVAEAAETAATALTQFQLRGEQVPHVADLLAAAAGKAQGSVSDMGMALKQSGLVASQTGLTIEETTGTLAAFASAGLIGSDAGTSFKTMLQALTPSSDKARKTMDALGITAYDAQGNFIGMTEFAGNLRAGLEDLSVEQQNAAMKTIFGSDAVRAAAVIFQQGAEGIDGWIEKTNDSGYAAETAATRLDNLKGDLEALGGAFETALIGTGDGSQGMLRGLTQGLTGAINAYNDLPSAAKTATSAMLAGSAALGGSIWVGSKIVQGVANTREALENLGVSATTTARAGKVMAGAMKGLGVTAGVVAGLVAVTAAAEKIRGAFDEALPGVNALTGDLVDLADGRVDGLGAQFDSLGDSVDRIANKRWDMSASDSIGALVNIESDSLHDATREVEALDAALTNLVSTGGPDVAARALAELGESGQLSQAQMDELTRLLPNYKDALAGVSTEAKLTASQEKAAAEAAGELGGAMQAAGADIAAQEKALQEARKAATNTATSFFNLGDGLNDAKVSLGGWIKQMAQQADALNNFTANAQKAANRGLRQGLIAALKEAGPEGALRMKQLANATDAEIARANKAWAKGQRAIDRYIDATTAVPTEVSTNLVVNANGAINMVKTVTNLLNGIEDEEVVIKSIYTSSGGGGTVGRGGEKRAVGGAIFGPGSGTSDDVPIWASNGEHVWTAREVANAGGHAAVEAMRAQFRFAKGGAVDKYGTHMFDRLNAMHFADGGMVSGWQDRYSSDGAQAVPAKSVDGARTVEQLIKRFEGLGKAIRGVEKMTRRQERAVEDATAAVERETQERDAVLGQMADLASASTAGFRTSLFESERSTDNAWSANAGSTTGGWLANLSTDISGLTERTNLQAALAAAGLDGAAFEAALSEGTNSDLSSLLGSGQVQQFEDMFNQRSALLASTGGQAGDLRFGAELATQNAELARQTAIAERQETRLASMEQELRLLNREQREREKAAEKRADRQADRTGEAAGAAVRNEVVKGHRDKQMGGRGK